MRVSWGTCTLIGWLLLWACSGEIGITSNAGLPRQAGAAGDGSLPGLKPGEKPTPEYCETAPAMLGAIPLRRLSRVEYMNTIEDLLLGVDFTMPEIPEDTTEGGFENQARALSSPALLVERYEETASIAAEAAMADSQVRGQIMGCTHWTTAAEQDVCIDSFLTGFGRRAFRRPLSDEERDTYAAFIREQTQAIDFEAGIELAVSALLQAPQFSYRIEVGEGDGSVTQLEMASRLSYLLWQSMPDELLLDAAEAGELATATQIETQARRMLQAPRAREAMIDFHRQWLDFDGIYEEPKDSATFPDWGPEVVSAVREEVDRFVGQVMFDEDATIGSLLTSRASWVNGPLAALYGLPPVDDWTAVELPAEERAGILTRSDFLAGRSHLVNASPVLRGVLIADRMLCIDFGAPPADADTSTPKQDPSTGPKTNRQLFEERTAPAKCQACHVKINAIGFSLESYDAIGRYQTEDHSLPVDASGELLDTDVEGAFEGPIALSERLASSRMVSDCVAEKWLRYTVGHKPEDADGCLLDRAKQSLVASGGDIRELLISIVTSPDFTRGVRQ